jgi:hypothetical protein
MRWVEIFSTGKKTSKQGSEQDFPITRLANAVESYNPQNFRAPLIVQHDTKGVPDKAIASHPFCFGFPTQLQLVGDKLKAGFETIAPEFLEWVQNGNLISISPSFYTEDDPRNPTPGQLHLRHIAALGKDNPSCKNLAPLTELLDFAEAELFDHHIEGDWQVEFAETESTESVAVEQSPSQQELEYMEGMQRLALLGLRLAIERVGKTLEQIAVEANITVERLRIILDGGGEALWEEMSKICDAVGLTEEMEFAEPTSQELALRKREAELVQREAQLRRKGIVDFMEPLVASGKVLPGDRAALETVLFSLDLEASQPLEFAEGDTTVQKSPAEFIKGWLARLRPQVDYSEQVPSSNEEEPPAYTQPIPAGYSVNEQKAKQLATAKQYLAKHGGSLDEALKAVGAK